MVWATVFSGSAPAIIKVGDEHYTKYKEKEDAQKPEVSKMAPSSTDPIGIRSDNTKKALSEIQHTTHEHKYAWQNQVGSTSWAVLGKGNLSSVGCL